MVNTFSTDHYVIRHVSCIQLLHIQLSFVLRAIFKIYYCAFSKKEEYDVYYSRLRFLFVRPSSVLLPYSCIITIHDFAIFKGYIYVCVCLDSVSTCYLPRQFPRFRYYSPRGFSHYNIKYLLYPNGYTFCSIFYT